MGVGIDPTLIVPPPPHLSGKPAIDDDDDDDKYDEYVDDGYDYDGDDDDYNSDVDSGGTDENDYAIKDVPNFVTRGSTFTVDKGTTIRLPCYVDRLPSEFIALDKLWYWS